MTDTTKDSSSGACQFATNNNANSVTLVPGPIYNTLQFFGNTANLTEVTLYQNDTAITTVPVTQNPEGVYTADVMQAKMKF